MTCPECGRPVTDAHARFCPSCGAGLAELPGRHEVRRVVTVLFADIVGSTTLGEQHDPEAVRSMLARYFASARQAIERHGGTVEKFIGDAVMAVAEGEAVVCQTETLTTTTFAINDNSPAATDAMARRLYGVPVAVTNSIDVGSSLVGAFRDSERIYRTGAASITIHDSAPRTVGEATVADYAVNPLVLRAEMRAEVAPWRGSGFVLVEAAS